MSFEFRPAKRESVHLLMGVSGASGSGMFYSPDFDLVFTFGNAPAVAKYSADGGVTFNLCVFDVLQFNFHGLPL